MRLEHHTTVTEWLHQVEAAPEAERRGLFQARYPELTGAGATKAWLSRLPAEDRKLFSRLGLAKLRALYGVETDLTTGKQTSRWHRAGGQARAKAGQRCAQHGLYLNEHGDCAACLDEAEAQVDPR